MSFCLSPFPTFCSFGLQLSEKQKILDIIHQIFNVTVMYFPLLLGFVDFITFSRGENGEMGGELAQLYSVKFCGAA